MLLLLGCTAASDSGDAGPRGDTGPPTADTADTDDPGDTDTADTDDSGDTDTADSGDHDTSPPTYACPADMVPVPTDSPAWCIDPYEVTVAEGRATALVGVIPTVGVTFEEAAAACEATPALDAAGETYAMRHLATSAEWQDAGDGVVGEGGTDFPWGDTFDDSRCVTLSDAGARQFGGMQPTGSMPGCVSAFGLYDQVGNAWEWTDSGEHLDADAAIAALAAAGYTFTEDAAGLQLDSGEVSLLEFQAAGVQPPTLAVTTEGYLEIAASQIQTDPDEFFARGYLMASAPLAVRLERTSTADDAPWRLQAAREYDGRVLPDKRGCAWYTGTDHGCAVTASSRVHLPDFDGTIGFRCVAPPYAR